MFQYLGLILVLISWVLAMTLILKWRDKELVTISKHGAVSKKTKALFASALIGLGATFYYWILTWVVPRLQLGDTFISLLFLTIALVVVTALVPDTPGWRRNVHHIAAFGMAILYLPLVVLIINATTSEIARLIGLGCLIYMATSFVLVAIIGKAKQHYLIFQILYIVAMQVAILSAAYIG